MGFSVWQLFVSRRNGILIAELTFVNIVGLELAMECSSAHARLIGAINNSAIVVGQDRFQIFFFKRSEAGLKKI